MPLRIGEKLSFWSCRVEVIQMGSKSTQEERRRVICVGGGRKNSLTLKFGFLSACLTVFQNGKSYNNPIGGRRGSRTLTSLRRRDFKSLVSAIPPPAHQHTKNGGGTGIRTLDNGFAIRCLSPLGHAALFRLYH